MRNRRPLARLISIVAWLVPSAMRREFRREWEAELATEWAAATNATPRSRLRVVGRALGSIPDAMCLFRQQWSLDIMLQDLRHSWRVLARRPTYTAVVVLTLAIGIGTTTAMFSAIDAVLLRPLPYREPARLVAVWENDRVNLKPRYPVAPANWNDWRTQTRAFERLAAYASSGGSLSAGGDPFRVVVPAVTTDFFETLGVPPRLGRGFDSSESVLPRNRVLVLAYDTWQTRFGGDARVIDSTVQYNGVPFRVIGVMPQGFRFPSRNVDGWRPLVVTPQFLETRAQHFLSVFARLKPGVTAEQARADLEAVAEAAQKAYPDTNDQRGTTMVGLRDAIAGEARKPMLLLGAAVLLLLLIGAVNVANLMLVEATGRRRELALRSALGADRLRIARQLLAEGLLLALLGGALGVMVAAAATGALGRLAAAYVPRIEQVGIDARVLAFGAAVSLLTGIVFALVPAMKASRTDVQQDLRDGARGTVGGGVRLQGVLVIAEFAAAVVLVVAAGLVMKSFWNVLRVQPGFATRVLTASIELPRRYEQDATIRQFYSEVLARLAARSDVVAAGVVNNLPVSGNGWTAWLTIENEPRVAGEPPEVGYRTASAGYFQALQIPVLEGRGLSDHDTPEAMKVAVINRALAERFFSSRSPIGARIRIGPNPNAPWRTIVGIVGNMHHQGPDAAVAPEVFLPTAQDVNGDMAIAVRMDGDPASAAGAIREAVRAVDPTVMVWRLRTIDAMLDEHLAPRRLAMLLIQGFAAVALALALIGIYGVLSYTVSQRGPEFGVRLALGASPARILRSTIADGLRLAVPGIAVGALLALAVSRLARAVLFGVSPADPTSYAVVLGGMVAVAVLASYLPARRASRVDPITAIRAD